MSIFKHFVVMNPKAAEFCRMTQNILMVIMLFKFIQGHSMILGTNRKPIGLRHFLLVLYFPSCSAPLFMTLLCPSVNSSLCSPVVGAPCFVNSKRCGIDVVRPAYVRELSYDRL